jgi:site-specific DNA recombinase
MAEPAQKGHNATSGQVRAAAYVRVSTERQATEGLSLDEQVRQVEAHIAAQDWARVDTLIEAGVSGRRDDRPKLAEVMRLASDGRIDVLVIPKLDRLGRSTLHLLQVCADLKAAAVRLVSLGDSIDTSTAAGQMLLEILAAVASFESARIGERVASVTAARAASGKAHGRVPYGYRPGGKDGLLVDSAQAVIVQRIFTEYNAGKSQRQIARDLTRDGIPAKHGRPWVQGSISKLLANPVYAGTVRLNGESYDGTHKPLVDDATWRKVSQMRVAATVTRRGRTPVANHALSGGMLRCGCGETMNAITKPTRTPGVLYEVYACSGRMAHGPDHCQQKPVRREPIDRAIWSFFENVALDVDATRAAMTKQHDTKIAEIDALREQADREAHKTTEALARIERDYRDNRITADQWTKLDANLTAELAAATAQVTRLDQRRQALTADMEQIDIEAAVLEQIAELRAMVVGEIRDGGREGVNGFRAALRRLFNPFELADWRSSERAMGTALDDRDYPCPHPDLRLGPTMLLMPHVREDAITTWDDGAAFPALRRAALALRESNAQSLLIE